MILNKVLQIELSKAFRKTFKFDNKNIDYLIRRYNPKKYNNRAYLQMIASTNHPELRIEKDAFEMEIEKFANFVRMDSIKRDPSMSKPILEEKGVRKSIDTWSNHPGLSGQYDKTRSNMKKIKHFAVPKITVKEINDRFACEGKPLLEDFEGEIEDKKTGQSLFIVKQGEIDSDG